MTPAEDPSTQVRDLVGVSNAACRHSRYKGASGRPSTTAKA
ncbi:hypothetical protein [Streptomyces sp. NPDC059209]